MEPALLSAVASLYDGLAPDDVDDLHPLRLHSNIRSWDQLREWLTWARAQHATISVSKVNGGTGRAFLSIDAVVHGEAYRLQANTYSPYFSDYSDVPSPTPAPADFKELIASAK